MSLQRAIPNRPSQSSRILEVVETESGLTIKGKMITIPFQTLRDEGIADKKRDNVNQRVIVVEDASGNLFLYIKLDWNRLELARKLGSKVDSTEFGNVYAYAVETDGDVGKLRRMALADFDYALSLLPGAVVINHRCAGKPSEFLFRQLA
ncbi:hypothetical protein HY570_00415 [Candidatus Micrarchaeota archaeon]|nr:hypothetical protein [Candidatus Micrarchaeota archaeon]